MQHIFDTESISTVQGIRDTTNIGGFNQRRNAGQTSYAQPRTEGMLFKVCRLKSIMSVEYKRSIMVQGLE
jgi:hypothetical protein